MIVPASILAGNLLTPSETLEKYRHDKVEPLHDIYRLSDHQSFKDFERRKGEVLHSSELIYRLHRLAPTLAVQHQINFEHEWGLYFPGQRLIYLSGFQQGWLTEFSYAVVDHRDLPVEERRGWRTVLVRLMARGVLMWEEVVKEFGNSDGLNSDRWMIYTAPYRNQNGSECVAQNIANEMETY